ncbi:DUF2793 domain-containing protein [Salipiger sp. P9]|uniref:DUF2793 domain-containing protein n=1 Tax=Salipiger pentaromativorans TaxID=2943193 RepID=UPI002157CB1C|nr:DUF2793 domain-containing protein [Salipiger pentaromativorans]MCR8550874.1 DUF2793 domain-containing protein [Salipiger pentaromativorans]
MSDLSANLSLPYLAGAQAQKHVTHNEALEILDAVVQLAVASRSLAAPPADPPPGARYLLPAAASGAWSGQADRLALWDGLVWRFFEPRPGWRAYVLDEPAETVWQDGAWQDLPGPTATPMLGINSAADAGNRLAVAAPATLLSHEGAGHQLKINKAAAGDTASLLFQTGWSGRAEMGAAGSDDFAIKVSADGSAWTTALSLDAASGLASGAAVQGGMFDTDTGKLMTVPAFGLGSASGAAATDNDANACLVAGFNYRFSTSGLNCPVANPYGSTLHVFRGTGGSRIQQLFVSANGAKLWCRGSFDTGASWTDWVELFTQKSILGTVSESAGVPTGALAERGSNASGEYLRLADGTQICSASLSLAYADGSGLWARWSFPAVFAAAPLTAHQLWGADLIANATPDIAELAGMSREALTASYADLWVRRVAGLTDFQPGDTAQVDVLAVGRWF